MNCCNQCKFDLQDVALDHPKDQCCIQHSSWLTVFFFLLSVKWTVVPVVYALHAKVTYARSQTHDQRSSSSMYTGQWLCNVKSHASEEAVHKQLQCAAILTYVQRKPSVVVYLFFLYKFVL